MAAMIEAEGAVLSSEIEKETFSRLEREADHARGPGETVKTTEAEILFQRLTGPNVSNAESMIDRLTGKSVPGSTISGRETTLRVAAVLGIVQPRQERYPR